MVSSINSYLPFYSNHSTYATSYERPEIAQTLENEGYRILAEKAGYGTPQSIMFIEPLTDYLSPNPIRSYNVKIRIISRDKGLPANYNEECEDIS